MRREERWHVFFFQAEDGIRYYKVTGVQTCALPISVDLVARVLRRCANERDRSRFHMRKKCILLRLVEAVDLVGEEDGAAPRLEPLFRQIGRASCRERV